MWRDRCPSPPPRTVAAPGPDGAPATPDEPTTPTEPEAGAGRAPAPVARGPPGARPHRGAARRRCGAAGHHVAPGRRLRDRGDHRPPRRSRTRRSSGPTRAPGPYHHPLPLVYALVWAPYELFGQRSSAQLAATVWFNAVLIGLLGVDHRPPPGARPGPPAARRHHRRSPAPTSPATCRSPGTPTSASCPAVAAGRRGVADHARPPLVPARSPPGWRRGASARTSATPPPSSASRPSPSSGLPLALVRQHGRAGWRLLGWPLLASLGVLLVMVSPALADLAQHGSTSNPSAIWKVGADHPRTRSSPTTPPGRRSSATCPSGPTWATGHRPYAVFGRLPDTPVPLLLVPLVLAVGLRRVAPRGRRAARRSPRSRSAVLTDRHRHPPPPVRPPRRLVPAPDARDGGEPRGHRAPWSLCRSALARHRPARVAAPSRVAGVLRTAGATVVAAALALLIVPTLHEQKVTADMAAALPRWWPRRAGVPKSHTIVLESPYKYDGYHPEAPGPRPRPGRVHRALPATRRLPLRRRASPSSPRAGPSPTSTRSSRAKADYRPAPGARRLGQTAPVHARCSCRGWRRWWCG